jgi:glycosyltransferase involved in cell wall biosynthesis
VRCHSRFDSRLASGQPAAVAELAALIPALDCEATIGTVVRGTREHVARVLVVDDGSSDRTADAAKAAGADVIRQPANRGKGAALRAGMRALRERGVTHVLTLDGDGQHLPEEIPALLCASAARPRALILGARQHEPGSLAGIRVFGNRFANRWVEIACGERLEDTQSGLRVYPLGETLALGCRADRFAFETEVVIRAARAGIPIGSVPVRVYNPPPGERSSHFRGFSDTLRIVLTVIGLLLRIW